MKAVLGRMFRVAWGGRSKPGNLRCPVLFSSQLVSFSTNTAVRKILTGKSGFLLNSRNVMISADSGMRWFQVASLSNGTIAPWIVFLISPREIKNQHFQTGASSIERDPPPWALW